VQTSLIERWPSSKDHTPPGIGSGEKPSATKPNRHLSGRDLAGSNPGPNRLYIPLQIDLDPRIILTPVETDVKCHRPNTGRAGTARNSVHWTTAPGLSSATAGRTHRTGIWELRCFPIDVVLRVDPEIPTVGSSWNYLATAGREPKPPWAGTGRDSCQAPWPPPGGGRKGKSTGSMPASAAAIRIRLGNGGVPCTSLRGDPLLATRPGRR
jgi:hypothetical protein